MVCTTSDSYATPNEVPPSALNAVESVVHNSRFGRALRARWRTPRVEVQTHSNISKERRRQQCRYPERNALCTVCRMKLTVTKLRAVSAKSSAWLLGAITICVGLSCSSSDAENGGAPSAGA